MPHGLVHFPSVAEPHLDFGGVDVDVDPRRVDFQVQRIHRLALPVQHILIRAARRVRQHLVAHETPVDIEKLLVTP